MWEEPLLSKILTVKLNHIKYCSMKTFMKNFPLFLLFAGLILFFPSCAKEEEPTGDTPVITTVTPAEGTIGTELKIEGSGFMSEATVMVGAIKCTDIDVVDASTIFATVPAGIPANTALAVTVTNPGGRKTVKENAFTGISPVLSFINSATKPSGNIGSTVIIEGIAFGDVQGEGLVLFSNSTGETVEATIASPEDWTDTFIVTTVPQGAADGPVIIKTGTGTSNPIGFTIASSATFSPSAINWKMAAALPTGVSGHNARFAIVDKTEGASKMLVYITGGRNSQNQSIDQVLVGEIGENGNIAAWESATALPAPLSFHAKVIATPYNSKVQGAGYIYTLGGTGDAGTPLNSVYRAKINDDGAPGTWTTTTALPLPLHSSGAVIFRGFVYLAGGATTDNEPTDKVFRAAILPDGSLGQWEEMPSLPLARAHHGLVIFGGIIYSVGGETSAVEPQSATAKANTGEVLYARINIRNGNITDAAWTVNPNSLQKTRSKHITLIAGGNIFISSGQYSAATQGSSENTYAQINSDGTVGSFAGATGSNTLLSTGGANLFSATGVSYVDANGVSHVLVIGGDNLNQPGNKRTNVMYY
jgi:hypothetical protein